MAMTEQARLAQKTKRAAKKPAKPAIVRTVAVLRDELPPKILAGAPAYQIAAWMAKRAEFLTVAAGAVPLVYAELCRKTVPHPFWTAAVDAILVEADRRWPR